MTMSPATELANLKFTPRSSAWKHMEKFERLMATSYPHIADSDKWSLFVKTIDSNNNPAWNSRSGGMTPGRWLMELNEKWQRDNPPCEDPECHDCRNDAMSFEHLRNSFLGKWGGDDRVDSSAPAPAPRQQRHGPPSRTYTMPPQSIDSGSETESTMPSNQHVALVPHSRSSVHMPPSAPTPPNEQVTDDDDGMIQETKTSISINAEHGSGQIVLSISDNKQKKRKSQKPRPQSQLQQQNAADYHSRPASPVNVIEAHPEPHLELYKPTSQSRPPTPPRDPNRERAQGVHRSSSHGHDPRDRDPRDQRDPRDRDPRDLRDPRNRNSQEHERHDSRDRDSRDSRDPRDYDDDALQRSHTRSPSLHHELTHHSNFPPRSLTSTPPPPPLRPRLLEGKIAAITGASRGIGRALALGFAREGAHIIAHYWGTKSDPSNEEIVSLCVAIRSLNQGCTIVFGDISDPRTSETIVRRAVETYGRLDIAVGNAGMCWYRDFLDVTPELLRRHVDVNLNGNFYFVQACARQFKRQWHELQEAEDGGSQDCSVICIAGNNGGDGDRAAHFSPTAAGVRELMRSCAQGLARYGVRCNTLAPGIVQTKMVREVVEDMETRARMEKRSPFGRLGVPGDVVGPAVWLAGDMGRWVNGQEIVVDGGSGVV